MRTQRIFGRRVVTVEGKQVRIEMRKDGVYVRPRYARRERVVSFTDLVTTAMGQLTMRFDERNS